MGALVVEGAFRTGIRRLAFRLDWGLWLFADSDLVELRFPGTIHTSSTGLGLKAVA